MNQSIPPLTKGDSIGIVAPAKAIEASYIQFAADFLEKEGFHVLVGPNCTGRHYYFSGNEKERHSDRGPQVTGVQIHRDKFLGLAAEQQQHQQQQHQQR